MNPRTLIHARTIQLRTISRSARLFLLSTVLHGISFATWMLFFNFFILQSGYDKDFLGLVNSAPSAAALVLGLPLGLLMDRVGRQRSLMLGLFVSTMSMALVVTLPNPILIVLMSFVLGAGNSLYFISQAPFLAKASAKENRSLVFSLNYGLAVLAGVVGNLLGGGMPTWFQGLFAIPIGSAQAYRLVLLAGVALSALSFVPLLFIREPRRQRTPEEQNNPLKHLQVILQKSITKQLSLPNLLIGIGAALLVPYFNLFFVERFAISDGLLGTLFSLSSLVTGVGIMLGPRIERFTGGRIRAVVLTQAASLVFLLTMGFSPFLWLTGFAFLGRQALMNMAVPLWDAFSMEQVTESDQGTLVSIQHLGWEFGWAVGPFLSALIQQAYGFTPLFIITALLYAAAVLFTWLVFRHKEASAPLGASLEGIQAP